jgi:hypothetical protein
MRENQRTALEKDMQGREKEGDIERGGDRERESGRW